jgi:hypothetical protein
LRVTFGAKPTGFSAVIFSFVPTEGLLSGFG